MNINGLKCVAYEAAVPVDALHVAPPEPFSVPTWRPDIASLAADQLLPGSEQIQSVSRILELIKHRQPITRALISGSPSKEFIDTVLEVLPSSCTVTVGFVGQQESHLSEYALTSTAAKNLDLTSDHWENEFKDDPQDVILVDYSSTASPQPILKSTKLLNLIDEGGWLVGRSGDFSLVPRH